MRPHRKSNSKRPFPPWAFYVQSAYGKIVETIGSLQEHLLLITICMVTAISVELKIGRLVLATSLNIL